MHRMSEDCATLIWVIGFSALTQSFWWSQASPDVMGNWFSELKHKLLGEGDIILSSADDFLKVTDSVTCAVPALLGGETRPCKRHQSPCVTDCSTTCRPASDCRGDRAQARLQIISSWTRRIIPVIVFVLQQRGNKTRKLLERLQIKRQRKHEPKTINRCGCSAALHGRYGNWRPTQVRCRFTWANASRSGLPAFKMYREKGAWELMLV